MTQNIETYEPRTELEKFGAEAFDESPNMKLLSNMLEGQVLKDSIMATAKKAFIDGFVVDISSLGQEVNE